MTLMTFTAEESARLAPHFTSLDTDVFGLRLPQEVSGALFSRYSRTAKSLRRVFLDEFLGDEGLTLAAREDSGDDAVKKARAFYDRVLVGYGDDSVAQLGGAHVAVERVSNVAAKMLEDGRVGMAYLEKSTRYVRFDQKDDSGSWLFHREEKLMASRHRETFLGLMEALFTAYSSWIDPVEAHVARSLPIEMVEVRHPVSGEPLAWSEVTKNELLRKQAERAYRATLRAHACDVVRGLLPGATLTNLGIFGSGQAYEHLLNKLHAQELSEGQALAGSLRRELDLLIPSFVKRAGRRASLVARDAATRDLAARWVEGSLPAAVESREVTLVDHDAGAEERILAASLYPHTNLPMQALRELVRGKSAEDRAEALTSLVAVRETRRDKLARAFENVSYTFDLLVNFGIYRDLQRHRVLTQERQLFTCEHGWDTPPEIKECGLSSHWLSLLGRAADAHATVAKELPLEAQYLVPFASRVRWYVTLNLREAVHLVELRSMPQGHPDYRRVVQTMWSEIERVHPALAGVARFLNRDTYRLGRLQSELRSEHKRAAWGSME